ncbi:RWD-domain-containing protein [Mollisia scopiformis]|uniref:RBR-type E3 ubiquitin transferase n=1 Tax=Mollisia scopiformis TaxID=149040 RepID=A0A194WTZ3_MOLSC|nr:RWD-domain-containing protein [Mollisia scopiformis]KUJ11425.1 RWD-domain-containing protein [Mollisia scopiformis]
MEDERGVEMECIAAIFPEIVFDSDNPFSATIELPVHPTSSVKVNFPASADGLLLTPPLSVTSGQEGDQSITEPANNVESHNLSYLPSLELRITLPEGYPEEKPAQFQLSTNPAWLSRSYLDELQEHGNHMWEEAGRSLVVYGYMDYLQQAAENAFGFAEKGRTLEIPQDFKISLLDYDIKETQAAFEKETFDCGICLDPKKGTVCHRMIDCGHVFCVQCLQEFYNNAITEGDLATVRCLAPDCAKKRAEARGGKKVRKSKIQLSPSELLQIPLEHEIVARYVKLKHKAELESDKNTIYCPRKWCQGAARSKKHRKPDGLEDTAESEDDSDNEESGKLEQFVAGRDLLSVCEDCSYAFCSRCYQGWHGEFFSCAPKTNTGELTEEDKASLEYMKLHTTPCPTCAAPAQKTHGCNHMICFKCHSHFCYLCSAWLSPSNPYKHYNEEKTSCYMRLWELEGGDGDDVGIGYAGGVRPVEIPPDPQEREIEVAVAADIVNNELRDIPEIVEPGDEDEPPEPRPEIQREGPLVLRINQPLPPPAPAVPDPPPAANVRNRPQRQQQPNRRVNNPAPVRGGLNRRREPHQRQQIRDAQAQAQGAAEQEEANQRWVRMFVQMAMNDEEDQLDSDDEDDAAAWEIPVR